MAKKKTNEKVHATASFEQLVGSANREALKPYINFEIQQAEIRLSQQFFRLQGNLQTRVMALEEILKTELNLTQAYIESRVADVEDDAQGYVNVYSSAKAGDLVRISVRTKTKEQDWTPATKVQLTSLMSEPSSIGSPTLEAAIVGLSAGNVTTVDLENEFKVEVTVDRVSIKRAPPVTEVPATATAPEGENV